MFIKYLLNVSTILDAEIEWRKSGLWKTNTATQHCQKTKTCFHFAGDSKGIFSPVSKLPQEEITKSSRLWGIRTGLNHINYFCQVSSIKTQEINDYRWVNMQSTHSPHRTETATHWLASSTTPMPASVKRQVKCWSLSKCGELGGRKRHAVLVHFPRLAGMASRSQQCWRMKLHASRPTHNDRTYVSSRTPHVSRQYTEKDLTKIPHAHVSID